MRTTLLSILLLLATATTMNAAETRGLTIVAKDSATNQSGEVKLYNKSYAVIIGIDQYQNLPPDRQLQNAVKDALGVETVLKNRYQFDKIFTLRNEEATRDRIMRLLTKELPKQMGKDDALFVFWSGHGNQENTDDGELGYLIPYDGNGDGIYGNVTMSQLRDDISKALPAKHIFYAFDACYSGLLTTRAVDNKTRRDLTYLKEVTKERVRQVLTAGSKGEEALDGGPKGHSVFTGRFIEILENADDFITANELQASIKERVYSDAKARNHTQTPGFGSLYGLGDFVFIPKQVDKLGSLTGASLARQKEIEQLRMMEVEANEAKKKEQAEIVRKQAELDALDKQIAEMKERLGTSAVRSTDSLDQIIALAEQKAEQGRRLEELRRQREAEEQKRQQEIEQLKRDAKAKLAEQLKADIAKYQKVADNKYAQDLKISAWDAMIANYPDAKKVERFDISGLLTALGLEAQALLDPTVYNGKVSDKDSRRKKSRIGPDFRSIVSSIKRAAIINIRGIRTDIFAKHFDKDGDGTQKTLGTGFIVTDSGFIITSKHLIENASNLRVRLYDQREYDASVIAKDSMYDLAVMKINARSKLEYLFFAAPDTIAKGDWVLAFGNPFGLARVVSAGLVESVDQIDKSGLPHIKTDAIAIDNSGGPLLNLNGDVVGVNSSTEYDDDFGKMFINDSPIRTSVPVAAAIKFLEQNGIRPAVAEIKSPPLSFSVDYVRNILPIEKLHSSVCTVYLNNEMMGAGFVISNDGHLMTSSSFFESHQKLTKGDKLEVTFDDAKKYEAKVIGIDASVGVALIKIYTGGHQFNVLPLGNSDSVSAGEWIVAMGSRSGTLDGISTGIIKAKGRVIGSGPYDDFFQVDAAISWADTGGPLLNLRGEVIGINTFSAGVAFAAPVNAAKSIVSASGKAKSLGTKSEDD